MAMVVAQLAERVLPVPLVRSLNPISDIIKQFSTNCNIEKTKIKKCPIFKRELLVFHYRFITKRHSNYSQWHQRSLNLTLFNHFVQSVK